MRRVALRGLRARPLRTALTALAVVLGVAMIAGTYIFTDTINRSFTEVFAQANTGTDVAVSSKKVDEDFFGDPPPLDEAIVERVRAVDGVKAASGAVFAEVSIRDARRRPGRQRQLRLVAAAGPLRAVSLRHRASAGESRRDRPRRDDLQGAGLQARRHGEDRRRAGRAALHAHRRREVRRPGVDRGLPRRDRDAARRAGARRQAGQARRDLRRRRARRDPR